MHVYIQHPRPSIIAPVYIYPPFTTSTHTTSSSQSPTMTTHCLSLLIFSILLASAMGNPGPYPPQRGPKQLIAVEGMVYCQSCQQTGSWSLADAKPLPSAKVGLSCKDHKNRVRFYKSVQTNSKGYFYVPIQGPTDKTHYYLESPMEACTARLLSSPDLNCNLLTNINYGIEGSPLRDENKTMSGKGYKVVIYATGPMAFRPAFCPLEPRHY